MLSEMSRLLAMAGATAKKNVREAVRSRVLSGKCLIDACETECDRRGLCAKHYMAYFRELQSRPKRDRVEFENACIEEGKILASREVTRITDPNPFADL